MTGATGFLGSHLCYDLLREGNRVVALARASGSTSARDRVLDVLTTIASGSNDAEAFLERLEVVAGDIAEPHMGVPQSDYDRLQFDVEQTWHSAASLSFLEEDRDDIFKMNVGGTQNVLEFVSQTRGRRLHHVSTAYISGLRSGVVREDEVDVGQQFKNPYEESKCRVEQLVSTCHQGDQIQASVYRPSIIIGDSHSGRATHFHGVYAFIRGLWVITRRLRRGRPDSAIVELPLRITGSEITTLNFVPIDYVTAAMSALSKLDSSVGRTFHITNPEPTPNHHWLNIVCDQLGVRGIRLVSEDAFESEPMTRMEALFHRQTAFYRPYLQGEAIFDLTYVREALQNTSIQCPEVTAAFTRKMTGWYIDRLNNFET